MKIFQTSTTWQSLRMEIFLPYKYFLPPDENISDQCHVVAPPVVEVPHPPPLPPPHHQYPGALLHIVFYLRLWIIVCKMFAFPNILNIHLGKPIPTKGFLSAHIERQGWQVCNNQYLFDQTGGRARIYFWHIEWTFRKAGLQKTFSINNQSIRPDWRKSWQGGARSSLVISSLSHTTTTTQIPSEAPGQVWPSGGP